MPPGHRSIRSRCSETAIKRTIEGEFPFHDNDSGGDGDSKIDFTTPQEGNYLLLVGDYTDAVTACYGTK